MFAADNVEHFPRSPGEDDFVNAGMVLDVELQHIVERIVGRAVRQSCERLFRILHLMSPNGLPKLTLTFAHIVRLRRIDWAEFFIGSTTDTADIDGVSIQ